MGHYLTDGKARERLFISQILDPGQTGVCDRGYQEHALFDSLHAECKSCIIRIKSNTAKTAVQQNDVQQGGIVFYDAEVLLGTDQNNTQTKNPVRLVTYHINNVDYWIATDRRDLTAEQIAEACKRRWEIESFFGWWKRHLKIYHLIVRSRYGLMVQIYAGLITYLLLAIDWQEVHKKRVSIKRVREFSIQIQNELRKNGCSPADFFLGVQIIDKGQSVCFVFTEPTAKLSSMFVNRIETSLKTCLQGYLSVSKTDFSLNAIMANPV